jgi:hypothetical protein
MMNLLIIRDWLKAFFQKWDRFLIPVVRFGYTMVVLLSFHQLFGYNENLYKLPVVFAVSFVCALVPSGVIYLVLSVIAVVDVFSLNVEAALLLIVLFLLIYLLYLRMVPGKSYIVLLTMVMLMRLPCCVPLLVAMIVGPVGIVPTICGIVLYYYSIHVHALQPLLNASVDDAQVSPVMYLLENLVQDKTMLLFLVVFSVVIMITYLIYSSSIKHGWSIAIGVGTLCMMLGLLAGNVLLEDNIELRVIVVGSLLSFVIAYAVQFFKGVLDYSRTEYVQFEDDDYYYFVKAVPKVSVAAKNVNVQKINERKR